MPRVTPQPGLAGRLADLRLEAAYGPAVRLGDLWEQRTAILVHLRHFG